MAASISDIRLLLKVKSLPKSTDFRRVFIAGGTGYIGSALLPILLERGHRVRVLVRPGSKAQLPAECEVVSGNPLDANSYRQLIRPADTFIHLVGVAHPSRAKAAEFRAVDLISVREAVSACGELGVQHFVYLSVAHPAPLGIMKNYIAVRAQCEKMIEERRLNCSILRPWYVVGPGRRWPYLLMPFYKVCEWLPFARGAALRLGLVTLDELILALIDAVESPAQGGRVIEVPEIREAGLNLTRKATRKASLSLR
ncbi:MAG: NAD(P)H-binding protein [Terriglobales bacterium]